MGDRIPKMHEVSSHSSCGIFANKVTAFLLSTISIVIRCLTFIKLVYILHLL